MTTPRAPLIKQDSDSISSHGDYGAHSGALSNKLTSILSSSFADSEVREALRLADARYKWDNDESQVDLKHEAQKDVIQANGKIVDDFAKVAKQLEHVGTLISTLNRTCDDMRKRILAAKQETAPMLEEASMLLAQRQETETKKQLLEAFNKHFLVSDEDLSILTNSTEPVDNRFFAVLARVKQIHKDCEILLGYENQRLGLELMEQTTRNLDAGYKKLYTCTQRDFKGLDLENPQSSSSIRRSLRALSERPSLFQNCLGFFAEARQTTLAEAFRAALTDSSMGPAKAIDFSTHDPLRYMGDMLAWVHSTTVSEMEALEGLFVADAQEISTSLARGRMTDPWERTKSVLDTAADDVDGDEEVPFDGRAALNSLISRNMTLVAQTLAQRVSVTVQNLSDPIEIYKAYNILFFYRDMFNKLITHSVKSDASTEDNILLTTLSELLATTLHHFEVAVTEELHASIDDTPSSDLSPPQALTDSLAQFTQIVQDRGPNLSLPEFTKLYSILLAPLLTACNDLASLADETISTSTCKPSTIFRTNYVTLVRDTMHTMHTSHSISAAHEPLVNAKSQLEQLTVHLTDELADQFTHASGLDKMRGLLEVAFTQHDNGHTRRSYLLTDGHLEDLAGRLDTFLAHALVDSQEELAKIKERRVVAEVLEGAVDVFVQRFGDVVKGLERIDGEAGQNKVNGVVGSNDEDEAEMTLREAYPRTVGEVEALLS